MISTTKIWEKLINLKKFFSENFIEYLNNTPNVNLMDIKEIQELWEIYENEKFNLSSEINTYLYEEIIKDALVVRLNKWISFLKELIDLRRSGNSIESKKKLKLISEELDSILLNYNEKLMRFRQMAFPTLSSNEIDKYIGKENLKNSLLKRDFRSGLVFLRQMFPDNNEIIAQLGRFEDLSDLISSGNINSLEFVSEKNRIRISLCELIDKLV